MLLQAYVERLNGIPSLAGKVVVGLPSQMENISSSPYAWISGVMEEARSSPVIGPVRQIVTLRIEVSVGARDIDSMMDTRTAVKDAMLNFHPDPSDYAPMEFRMGRMEFADPGWWFWRDEYVTDYEMR